MSKHSKSSHSKSQIITTSTQPALQNILKQHLTTGFVIQMGMRFAKKSFWVSIVFSLLIAGTLYGYGLQPQTTPNMADLYDWVSLIFLAIGIWLLSILHAALIIQINSTIHEQPLELFNAIRLGMQKSLAVFMVCVLYLALATLAFILFFQIKQYGEATQYPEYFPYIGLTLVMLPMLALSVSFYLALFIVVLAEHKKETPWYKKIVDYFHESIFLLKGYWWKMVGLIFLGLTIMAITWVLYHLFLKGSVVFAVMFYVFISAATMIFWYGCMIALVLELKARKKEKQQILVQAKMV